MAFGCIFVPNFMLQAVVRSEPGLRERSVALVDGTAPVWSVVGMNEAAARAGIQLGMTKSQAQQFCDIEIRHRSRVQEKASHAVLMDLGWSVSPRVEDAAPDTIVVDLAGLNSLFGADEKILTQLANRALGLGLSAQIAAASKIDAAIIAARGCAGVTVIPEGEEAKIIGSLPVNVLFPSLGTSFKSGFASTNPETLERWGVRTCEALAALPILQISERLGQEGVRLHELARAQSERSMVLAEPEIHFEEEMELENAVDELEPLAFLLGRLLDQLCARLDARSLAACAVRVRFELDPGFEAEVEGGNHPSRTTPARAKPARASDHGNQTVSSDDSRHPAALGAGLSTIATATPRPQGNSEPKIEPKIYEQVLSLPVPMRDSKMLLKLVRLHLQADAPRAPILKIFLAADAARPRVTQGGLFLPSSPDPEKLELTVARLANLVGDANVGSPELMDTHRPEEFRMRRFVWLSGGTETHSTSSGQARKTRRAIAPRLPETHSEPMNPKVKTGFRIFRPALPAEVELREGCPTRISFQGIHGRVVAASGPWRSSGDWWREDGWHNDEWDLEIEFSSATGSRQRGLYRVFCDAIRQAWLVRGAYD